MIPCSWQLVVCGINHKSSALERREPLQVNREDMARANATLCDLPGVRESVFLSTCNRIECYMVVDRDRNAFDIVSEFYRQLRGLDISQLEPRFYSRKDKHAADHLFRVSAGLDSMVVGENEILGQVKDAYSSACNVKSAGKVMHRLFHQAFRIGKQVRSDTELGQGACSVSTAMIEILKPYLEAREKPTILFVGLNQMITMATARLKRRGYDRFIFVNRTLQRAVEFAKQHNATGHNLDELPALLADADIVITCTGSNDPIVTDDTIDGMAEAHSGKKLVIADMAVPRDVELKRKHPGVTCYDLETVKSHVENQQSIREDAVPDAEVIVDRKLEQFMYWFEHVRHEPIYNGLNEIFETIRREEMKRIVKEIPPESRDAIDRATRRLVERISQIKTRTEAAPQQTEK
jgi:glutamyl-tRNA reductase